MTDPRPLEFVPTRELLTELQQRFHTVGFVGYQERGLDTHSFVHHMHGDRFRLIGMLTLLTRFVLDDHLRFVRQDVEGMTP